MRRVVIFLLLLLTGLGGLTVLADWLLVRTTHRWYADDMMLRSQLAVAAARQGLAANWKVDPVKLSQTLADIARDEHILAAAACSGDGKVLARTPEYPREYPCVALALALPPIDGAMWTTTSHLRSGAAQLSVHALRDEQGALGAIVLVHDLAYLDQREATTRNFIIIAFAVLSVAAAVFTIIAARFAWRDWTVALRRALAGDDSKEFQPLVRDVRALVAQLAEERDTRAQGGTWNPDRLRATLSQYLQGERVVILANREPYIHVRGNGDEIRVLHPASGLVSALEPVMRACSGVWVAHGAGNADRNTVDDNDHVRVPPGEESYEVRRVWLSDQEEQGYYYGFSNEGLWPLCHVAHTRPIFRAEDWEQYVTVNRRFADAVCEEVDSDHPIILVQDYHFALAPKMIRERLPHATILTFWHIPWPNSERFAICPWREEILAGLLGSSIVGFHTHQHCNNFIDSVDAFLECRIDRELNTVIQGEGRTAIRAYPISVEWPIHWLATTPSVEECRRSLRAELNLPADALIGLGVDRLDYTKGIEERLLAVDQLLQHHPSLRGRFTFVQLAAPSRTKIAHYHELNKRVDKLAAEINQRWQNGDYRPVILHRTHHEPPTVFRYFRGADLCYVSSLHDGMNLVAKEFVAARDDEAGVLVLSQFTGAARDLTEALIVNPYDVRQAGDALAAALKMPRAEQRERMRSMRRLVSEFNVYRWAGRMIVDAAETRRRDRVQGRLRARYRQSEAP